eukprot:CAMPEP_0198152640 /NCGR_PEP_ID=MMETSP1443-20131203/60676_1 /TAXON_ID=186043 /ORGANISM="Entomoneis sp., Strain CCMP2396" /LENGTH=388 /DNA_ID=CAMNT_0043818731 /DNA_START=21 /DNA_END=1187 /DNA_ORIENTATION=+
MKAKSYDASAATNMLMKPMVLAPVAAPRMSFRDDVSLSSTFTAERQFHKPQHVPVPAAAQEDSLHDSLKQHHERLQQQQLYDEEQEEEEDEHQFEDEQHQDEEDEFIYEEEPILPPVSPRTCPVVVQFNTSLNMYHEIDTTVDDWTGTDEDSEARWYQQSDYREFKNNVINIVKAVLKAQARRQQKITEDSASESLGKETSSAGKCFSYSNTIEDCYNACFQMEMETKSMIIFTKEEMSQLKRLYRTTLDTECVLGLERLLVQRIGKDRSELRCSLLGILQDLQTTRDCAWPDRNVLNENMFQISQEVSRPARLFARHLAQAQAMATCKDNNASNSTSTSARANSSDIIGGSSSSKHKKGSSKHHRSQQGKAPQQKNALSKEPRRNSN